MAPGLTSVHSIDLDFPAPSNLGERGFFIASVNLERLRGQCFKTMYRVRPSHGQGPALLDLVANLDGSLAHWLSSLPSWYKSYQGCVMTQGLTCMSYKASLGPDKSGGCGICAVDAADFELSLDKCKFHNQDLPDP